MKLQTKKFTKTLVFSAMALSLSACELLEGDDDDEVVEIENSAPTITSTGVLSVEAGNTYSYTLAATDSDGDTLTLEASSLPSWLSFDATSGVLSGTPAASDEGSHSVTLSVSDGTSSTTQSFTINVTVPAVNNAPVVSSTAATTATEGTEYSYTLTATDADGDTLTMAATTLPAWLSFDAASGVLSGTPAASDAGDHNVVLTVSDAEDNVTDTFSISVSALPVDTTPTTGALAIFDDSIETGWFAWDESGEYAPVVATDDDSARGEVIEFKITGSQVAGFSTRAEHGATNGILHDASSIATDGTLSFDLKMTQEATAGSLDWFVKLESTDGATVKGVERNLTTSQEGHSAPVLDTWQTYTFNLKTFADAGLDMSKIDLVMIFPQWGQGDGAMYKLDNVQFNVDGSDDGQNNGGGDSGSNLIANGSFDTNAGWGGTDGMVDSIANGIFTADVAAAGNPWDVSLKYNLTLTPDTTYELTFDARSDDARSISAAIGQDADPWLNDTETVNLTTDWATYTVTLTTTGFGEANNRAFFDMGDVVGHVELDNVSLKVADDSGTGGETGGDLSAYCGTEVFHFGNTAQTDSMALLTIESIDANTLEITVASDDDDPIDALVINGALGGVRGDQDTSVAGQISQTLYWDTAPANVVFNLLWSHGSFAGNWQLSEGDTTVPFSAACNDDGGDTGGDTGTGDTSPTEAASTPVTAETDVVSVFSDAYTDISDVNVNPNWGQATATSITQVAGNDTVVMENLNYQGIEFPETDISAKATLNIDYWTADATAFDVYLISTGPAETPYNVTTTQGGWQTLEISLTEFTPTVDLTKVFQFKFVASGSPTIYFDNIYFSGTGDNGSGSDGGTATPGTELVATGSFDSTTNWGGTDGMVASIANGVFTADVATAGNAWDVSLKYSLSLVANTTYELSFEARSDDSRDIIAGIGLDNAPWDNDVETVSLTPDWTTYTLTLTAAGFGGNTDRVFFDLGASAGHVQLDNVSLKAVAD